MKKIIKLNAASIKTISTPYFHQIKSLKKLHLLSCFGFGNNNIKKD